MTECPSCFPFSIFQQINLFFFAKQRHSVFSSCLQIFVAALLLGVNHPAHVNVVLGKRFLGVHDGGFRQGSSSAQDPGKVNMEEPQNVRAGIH